MQRETGNTDTLYGHFIPHRPRHRCFLCNICFDDRKQLEKHRKKEHVRHRCQMCEFCGKEFNKPYLLRHHIDYVHHGIKYKCELCGKYYSEPKLLNKHLEQHATGTLPKIR